MGKVLTARGTLRLGKKPFIFTPMFFNRYITQFLSFYGLLLAGLLLRVAR